MAEPNFEINLGNENAKPKKEKKEASNLQNVAHLGKTPPRALDMEQAVIGALLLEKNALHRVMDVLKPEMFWDDRHKVIYESILQLFQDSKPLDMLIVKDQLKKNGELERAGGALYLAEITSRVASAANIEYHSRVIAEKFILRQLITISDEVIRDAYQETTDVFELLDLTEQKLFEVSETHLRRNYLGMPELVMKTLARLEELKNKDTSGVTGIPSGFMELDKLTSGWQKTDLVIVAARPAMGKCLGKDTPILMYDGSIKLVQDVKVGDLLMGDDSTPRKVLSLARGAEKMYWVRQNKGIDYRVNESHILSLKRNNEVIDIALLDYLQENDKNYKGYKVIPTFPNELSAAANTAQMSQPHLISKAYLADNQEELESEIVVEVDCEDEYFGFVIDGNHRFLLGDYTVTHNTAFTLTVARNAAVQFNIPVAFFSLEMAAVQLTQRLVCAEAEIDMQKIRTGRLEAYEWQQLITRIGNLSDAPLFIDDTPALSIMDLRAKCRRLKAEKKIEMVIIDYLQLMTGNASKGGNREQEIAGISRSLKELAKELDVCVIALAQLSRAVETRGGDKKPMLSDLRESGSIEQDADMVMALYRPEYYGFETDEDGNSTKGQAQVIIMKQRNGPTGEAKLAFLGSFGKFADANVTFGMTNTFPSSLNSTTSNQPNTIEPQKDYFSNAGGGTPNIITLPSKMNQLDGDDIVPF